MTASVRLAGVDPTDLFKAWPLVSPWIEASCSRPNCDLEPVVLFVACANQEAQLIVALDEAGEPVAAAVSQVRAYKSGRRTCWVLVAGGADCDWASALAQIEAGARAKGCEAVEFIGRRGWARVFSGYSAEPCDLGLHFAKSLGEAA